MKARHRSPHRPFPTRDARRDAITRSKFPWVMGLIGTRSLTQEIPGHQRKLVAESAHDRTRHHRPNTALMTIRDGATPPPPEVPRQPSRRNSDDLGYASCSALRPTIRAMPTARQIRMAAGRYVPGVAPLFWAFRIMVALGFSFIAVMAYFFWRAPRSGGCNSARWPLIRAVAIEFPTPWHSFGRNWAWFVAEFGRQPWTVTVLPPR